MKLKHTSAVRPLSTQARGPAPRAIRAVALAAGLVVAWAASPALADVVGDPIPWIGIPIHTALNPDGTLLTFGSTVNGDQGGFDTVIWNPRQGTGPASRVLIQNGANFDSFCVGGVLNPANGNILLAGGRSNQKASQYNFTSKQVEPTFTLKYPRYYATTTTLPDGRIHIVGGSPSYGNQSNASNISEVLTPGKGWAELAGTANGPMRRGDPAATGNPMWYPHVFPVRGTEVFIVAGKYQYFENYAGAGGIRNEQAFNGSNYGASSSAVMFRPGLVMHLGGGAESNGPQVNRGSNVASLFDLRGADAQGRSTVTRKDTFMQLGRHWPTTTLLPTGEVLVSGGSAVNNALDGVAYQTEIYNPDTGQWRMGASLTVPRLYHSTALLMKDGRVMVGGGGAPGPVVGNTVEIYTPDYLQKAGGLRPSVLTGPSRVKLGQTFRVTTDRAITRMTLVKTGVVTHGFNMDQRFFEAKFTPAANGAGYDVTFPNDAVNATPGVYMLFAFDNRGVPSEGKFIRLPSTLGDDGRNFPADTPTNPLTPPLDLPSTTWVNCAGEGQVCSFPGTRNVRYGANGSYAVREVTQTTNCDVASFFRDPLVGTYKTCQVEIGALKADASIAFEPASVIGYRVRHQNFQGFISPVNGGSPNLDWQDSSFTTRAGLGDGACYSFESKNYPGMYLRQNAQKVLLQASDGSPAYKVDATFCARPPANGDARGGALSLESKSNPGFFMRHFWFGLILARNDGSAEFKASATFLPVNPRAGLNAGSMVALEPITWPSWRVRHANFLGYISQVIPTSPAVDQLGSSWMSRPGLANAGCYSFESRDWPGYYLRHQNYRVRMDARDNTAVFDQTATFCPRAPLTGQQGGTAMALESNMPGYFLFHKNFELFIARDDGTAPTFKTDTTWVPKAP